MVKNRLRREGRGKPGRICAHMSMARGYGASVRTRIANATLAYDSYKIEEQKRTIRDSLMKY